MTARRTTLIAPRPRPVETPALVTRDTPLVSGAVMVDPFGRTITYLRLSVTDRCDLRCTYCMAEDMTFLPKRDLLTLEELDRLASAFVARGVRKLRITGGEPLVRREVMTLFEALARHLRSGALDELTLTTNATQLARYADQLAALGIKRINVSLDTRDRVVFERLTRRDQLPAVLDGIDAALAAGLKVKINTVALKHDNAAELPDLIAWAHSRSMDLTLIEAMPMGEIEEDRFDQYLPLSTVYTDLSSRWTLTPLSERTGGPARYHHVAETGGKLGLITPLSHNFCSDCNRVRVTCTGRIYMCLGQEDAVDLRKPLREHPRDDAPLGAAIDRAIGRKPEGHDFRIEKAGEAPAVPRHMSVTGG